MQITSKSYKILLLLRAQSYAFNTICKRHSITNTCSVVSPAAHQNVSQQRRQKRWWRVEWGSEGQKWAGEGRKKDRVNGSHPGKRECSHHQYPILLPRPDPSTPVKANLCQLLSWQVQVDSSHLMGLPLGEQLMPYLEETSATPHHCHKMQWLAFLHHCISKGNR